MPLILIQCPKTQKYLSTGIEVPPNNLEILQRDVAPAKCPYCGKEHRWTKQDAILVPADKWSELPQVQECLMKAIKSAQMAAAATSEEQRNDCLRMERKWVSMAEGYRFLAEVDRRFE